MDANLVLVKRLVLPVTPAVIRCRASVAASDTLSAVSAAHVWKDIGD